MKTKFHILILLCIMMGMATNNAIAFAGCMPSPADMATEAAANDTVVRIMDPETLQIVADGESLSIDVKGYHEEHGLGTYSYKYSTADNYSDWEINLPFISGHRERSHRRKNAPRITVDWFDNFYVGGVIGINEPAGMKAGWEIGVDNLVGFFLHTGRSGPIISLGAGMGYRSMNYGDGMVLSQTGRRLILMPLSDDAEGSSRLHLFRLSVPLMFTQPLGAGIKLRLGAILNLNTYASATTKLKIDNKRSKESFHSIEQRFATPDFLGSIVLCSSFAVYARWSPVSLFSSEWGPRYKAVSVGVSFVL